MSARWAQVLRSTSARVSRILQHQRVAARDAGGAVSGLGSVGHQLSGAAGTALNQIPILSIGLADVGSFNVRFRNVRDVNLGAANLGAQTWRLGNVGATASATPASATAISNGNSDSDRRRAAGLNAYRGRHAGSTNMVSPTRACATSGWQPTPAPATSGSGWWGTAYLTGIGGLNSGTGSHQLVQLRHQQHRFFNSGPATSASGQLQAASTPASA